MTDELEHIKKILAKAWIHLSIGCVYTFLYIKKPSVLDKYYVPTRYPNGLPGGIPSNAFDKIDAESHYTIIRTHRSNKNKIKIPGGGMDMIVEWQKVVRKKDKVVI